MLEVIGGRWEGSELIVTIEGDNVTEVTSAAARQMAIDAGPWFNMPMGGVSGTSRPYSAGLAGKGTTVQTLEAAKPGSRMRNDIHLLSRMQ